MSHLPLALLAASLVALHPVAAQDAARRATPFLDAPLATPRAAVSAAGRGPGPYPVVTSKDLSAIAVRASRSHVISADEHAPLWEGSQLIDGFRVYDPTEDGAPAMRTTAKVAYDDRNLYILVRAYDPHPDSIVALLSRRDVRTPSEWIKVMIDAYHDRRSGVELAVNPVGVKRDYAIYSDNTEDESWDGVWDVATRVDREGWVAEYRIPFSQLRMASKGAGESHTFGLMITRDIARTQERQSWPLYRRSKPGLASQFGDVTGIENVAPPRRLEVMPYSVTRNFQAERDLASGTKFERVSQQTFGADVKLGLGPNLTLDATINPDFGQVEADPGVLNLSAFEQFFQERRPFFLEGAGIFNSFNVNCNDGDCNGLLYSRRIGRSPQLSDYYGDATAPQFTPILAAGKLSGRLGNGLSIGVLDAVTERVKAPDGRTMEPGANYFVTRLMQDFRGGNSGVGMMFTATNRSLDVDSDSLIRKSAYVGGLDWRHRFWNNDWAFTGFLIGSHVSGSPSAIARTMRSGVQNFQRPGSLLPYDTTATSLGGLGYELGLSKNGGGIVRFNLSYQKLSPGFNMNDLGFLPRADQQGVYSWMGLQMVNPTTWYRRLYFNVSLYRQWNAAGIGQQMGSNVNSYMELPNYWSMFWGAFQENWFGENLDDRAARGGPSVRSIPAYGGWWGLNGDRRKPVTFDLFTQLSRGDEGRSTRWSVSPALVFRAANSLQGRIGAYYQRNVNAAQWNGNYGAIGNDTTHYTFAALRQRTISLTARIDYTITPRLSLQVYAEPFMTTGQYGNWQQLSNPLATSFQGRLAPFNGGDPGAFNYKQFRSNSVLRWEYRPGSVLYLVWSQGRTQYDTDQGVFNARNDVSNLFGVQPNNTFLIKTSYWFSL